MMVETCFIGTAKSIGQMLQERVHGVAKANVHQLVVTERMDEN